MINVNKVWAIEWNPEAKQTNIQFLSETIEGNLRYIQNGEGLPEWLLVGVAESPAEASRIADRIEQDFG